MTEHLGAWEGYFCARCFGVQLVFEGQEFFYGRFFEEGMVFFRSHLIWGGKCWGIDFLDWNDLEKTLGKLRMVEIFD